jgi:beta-glucanase (GH16 family)
MKNFYLIFVFFIYSQSLVYSQPEYRFNESYTTTELFDDFTNNLNPNTWFATTHLIKGLSGNPFIYVDSTVTINVDTNNSRLCLSMISSPNYTATDWDGNPITADYIVGEVNSEEFFSYGIFECNARFAHDFGSFPAFWLYGGGGVDCSIDHINEIDIVECRVHSFHGTPLPKLQNHIFDYPPPCGSAVGYEFTETQDINWDVNHTFKCIWSPYRITFWIDDTLLKEVVYQGQSWYPNHHMRVILSQQVQSGTLVVPQTSYFNWVKVRSFFLAPEITCPNLICSSGTATLDVDNNAENITWQLSPSNLFSTTSGSGSTANINTQSGASGLATITFAFEMPGGEEFTKQKDFWVGAPKIDYISGPTYAPNNDWATYYAHPNNYLMSATDYEWILSPLNGNSVYDYGWTTDIAFYNQGTYQLVSRAQNTCGWGPYTVLGLEVYNSRSLAISPNPTTGETTITINPASEKELLVSAWDLEIFTPTQALKEKKTRLKGSSTVINTASWQEGVYVVRALYNNEVITGKLIVKR